MNTESNFVELKNASRIWAIGSVHSNLDSFSSIKKFITKSFKPNDKLIFLGNVIGLGNYSKETLTSVIDLRFKLMSKYKLSSSEIIFLRGAQEEMFNKLLQLQIAPNPTEIVKWMFEHGVDKTLESYGYSKQEILNVSSTGTLSISKWTAKLNKTILK